MAAQGQVTNYNELKAHVADTLLRSDLTTVIPTFIQMLEHDLNTDERVRKLTDTGGLSLSGDDVALPSDFLSVESWAHDGGTYTGPIEIVNADQLSQLKGRVGSTGVPRYAAIIDGVAKLAPVPSGQTFSTEFIYWRKVPALTGDNTTNWLIDDHSNIYIYGTLMQAAPYLRDDARLATWGSLLDKGLEQLHKMTEAQQYGGSLRRQFRPIG